MLSFGGFSEITGLHLFFKKVFTIMDHLQESLSL